MAEWETPDDRLNFATSRQFRHAGWVRTNRRQADRERDARADWPSEPELEDPLVRIQRIIDDEWFPVWWRDPSLASIGLIECRTFGKHRAILER